MLVSYMPLAWSFGHFTKRGHTVPLEAQARHTYCQGQNMVKQARNRAPEAGPRTTLIDLWRGDQQEVVAAFLPLKSIAAVPVISRRFRDQQPLVLFRLARRHGCANALTVASLDALAASGRDWSTFSGDAVDAWRILPSAGDADDCFAISVDTAEHYIEISTDGYSDHGGGLVKRFDAADRLCVRQLKYRFRFTDSNPEASHADPGEHGFAYFSMGDGADTNGLLVAPTATGYELTWFYCDDPDDEEEDGPENAIVSVAPGRWYDVTVTFDWTIDESAENWAFVTCEGDDGTIERKKRVLSSRQPLTAMRLYNYSPSVAHYSNLGVKYSPHTSRDGEFFNSEEE